MKNKKKYAPYGVFCHLFQKTVDRPYVNGKTDIPVFMEIRYGGGRAGKKKMNVE
jgi:hypothetical protein